MLPHTKRAGIGIGKFLYFLGVLIPIFFMILYFFKFGKNDTCNYGLDANYAYNSNNKTTKYMTLKILGNGKRDMFIMLLGYLIEMALLGMMYNLLYNVILIH